MCETGLHNTKKRTVYKADMHRAQHSCSIKQIEIHNALVVYGVFLSRRNASHRLDSKIWLVECEVPKVRTSIYDLMYCNLQKCKKFQEKLGFFLLSWGYGFMTKL
jgi:hypothetical protein